MILDPLRLEFGRYTDWILEAVEAVGVEDPIAVACRGTADVALFEDLADGIGAHPGMRVLDLGCGMGGPAAWLRRQRGCDVVGLDLMEQGVRAARRLFAHDLSVVGSTYALPFPAGAFAGVWAAGVLELIEDKATALREMARVLEPGGRAAVYSYTSVTDELDDPPASDFFVSADAMGALAEEAGLQIHRAGPAAPAGGDDRGWRQTRALVEGEIRRRHAGEPEFELVREELARFRRLRAAAAVRPWRFDLGAPPA